jgi:hypothetical protein
VEGGRGADQVSDIVLRELPVPDSGPTIGRGAAANKVQKKIIRDLLARTNDRKKMDGWLPNHMGFAFRAYTKYGGLRIADAWRKVKGLI